MRKLVDVICFVGGGFLLTLHFTKTRVFDFITWNVEGKYGTYTKGLDDFICPALLPIGVVLIIFGFIYNKWQRKEYQDDTKKTIPFIAVIFFLVINLISIQSQSEKISTIEEKMSDIKSEVEGREPIFFKNNTMRGVIDDIDNKTDDIGSRIDDIEFLVRSKY